MGGGGCFHVVGGGEWTEVTVQNCGRAPVKPKIQPGGAVLAP